MSLTEALRQRLEIPAVLACEATDPARVRHEKGDRAEKANGQQKQPDHGDTSTTSGAEARDHTTGEQDEDRRDPGQHGPPGQPAEESPEAPGANLEVRGAIETVAAVRASRWKIIRPGSRCERIVGAHGAAGLGIHCEQFGNSPGATATATMEGPPCRQLPGGSSQSFEGVESPQPCRGTGIFHRCSHA